MAYFFWLSIALVVSTLIFYLIFAGFIYYYHEKKTTLLMVPLLYAFDFFVTGFLVISLLSILLAYLPDMITIVGTSHFSIWP